MTITEIRHQIETSIDRLSLERLKVAADFLADLAAHTADSNENQDEILPMRTTPPHLIGQGKTLGDIVSINS